jgi:hypothetical protein
LKIAHTLFLALCTLPLAAQAWDVRLEAPFPKGQDLPQALIQNTGQRVSGNLDAGHGLILTLSHRIVRVGPVLKLEWNAEYSRLWADGQIQQGTAANASRLRQTGLGAGVNAQFWVPFTGFAGELGLTERFHAYRYEGAGAGEDRTIARPWLRAGLRWNLPFPGIGPYLAASYQAPLTRDKPVASGTASSLGSYLGTQGAGQEFQHLWTLGVGVSF